MPNAFVAATVSVAVRDASRTQLVAQATDTSCVAPTISVPLFGDSGHHAAEAAGHISAVLPVLRTASWADPPVHGNAKDGASTAIDATSGVSVSWST